MSAIPIGLPPPQRPTGVLTTPRPLTDTEIKIIAAHMDAVRRVKYTPLSPAAAGTSCVPRRVWVCEYCGGRQYLQPEGSCPGCGSRKWSVETIK